MNEAITIIRSAESLGITLWVEGDQLRYKARNPVNDGLKNRIRAHKAEIITLLLSSKQQGETTRPAVPEWCNTRCEQFHKLAVPEIGTMMWCCFEQDKNHWRRDRIDKMNGCPMVK